MKKKQIVTWLIALVVIIAAAISLPKTAKAEGDGNSGTCGDNLTWVLDSDGVLTISGTGEMYDYGDPFYDSDVEISPWMKSEKNEDIKKVVIEDNVTTIGEYAFLRCSNMTSIKIPDSVLKIGDSAFYNSGLISIDIPDGVTGIGSKTFWYCENLASVNLPDEISTIGSYAFENCSSLTSIDIPDGLTSIGECAFRFCYDLKSIVIPSSVKELEYEVFAYCRSIKSVTIPNNVDTIGNGAFYKCWYLTNVNIQDGVKTIKNSAFEGCYYLKSVTIPDSVTVVETRAFANCGELRKISIPKSVTTIGDRAFGYTVFQSDESEIYDEFTKIEGFTVNGYTGSAAETYAKENEFAFIDLENGETTDNSEAEIVKTVEDMISALTDSSSESTVQAARNAYNALTADQKKQVSDSAVTKLTNAEKKIAEAKAAADKAVAEKAAAEKAAAEKAAADKAAAEKAAAAKAAADKAAADKAAAEKAANITVDGVAVNLASAQTTDQMDKTVTGRKSDADMSGSLYRTLQAKVSSAGKTSNKVTWKKVSGADGYIVYGSKCGAKNSMAKLKTLSGTSFTQKKLKSGTYYKYMVVAYKNYNGAAKVIATSKTIHVATTGGKVGNPKKVTTLAKKNKVTLKKGKTFKLGAKAVAQSKKLKVKKHRALKYETSNAAVATVSGAGKITAKGKGSCYVYVYAQNGVAAKISVKVK